MSFFSVTFVDMPCRAPVTLLGDREAVSGVISLLVCQRKKFQVSECSMGPIQPKFFGWGHTEYWMKDEDRF
jgi:hypothetical protein